MALDTLPTVTRSQLQEVFKDPRTLLAFEAVLRQVTQTIPGNITEFQALDFIVGALNPLIPNARALTGGAGINLTLNPTSAVLDLTHTGVTAGTYFYANIVVDAYGRITAATGSTAVATFSGGTTGLTPSGATSGAVILSGTLVVANGGTGAATAAGARTNLGLGGAAVLNVGTAAGTVAAGNDSRFANALPNYSTVATDADLTITRQASLTIVRHTGTLTANRAVTLSTTGAVAGDTIQLTRTGAGAFNLTFAGKALVTNTWASAVYDGAAWYLATSGAL